MKKRRLFKTGAALMAVAVLTLSGCGSKTADAGKTASTASKPAATGEGDTFKGIYFDTDIWMPVPMISQSLIDAGYENYEACQACAYVVLDPIDGQLGFYGIDVGGFYRTNDGGKTWTPSTIGFNAAGATGFAIDPNNIDRVIAIGCDSGYSKKNGVSLSTDGGLTWEDKFHPGDEGFEGQIGIHNDYRVQVAFDESSMDKKIGGSAIVYWDRENLTANEKSGNLNHPALYKSTDGGETWKELEGTSEMAGGTIVVHPKDGRVAVANEKGAWVSTDKGESFKKVSDLAVNTIFGVRTRPDNLYALTNDGLYVSTDFGTTFKKTESSNFPTQRIKKATNLRVSPSNPDHMMMMWTGTAHTYDYATYYTKDGGKTWAKSKQDKSGIWIPMNSWYATFWYSPVDENYIIANEYRSEDGGENFFVSTKGFNGICVGGRLSININDERFMSIGSQDFNGGYSTDSGKTWTYVNWSGKGWGGFTYGAYTLNENVSVTTVSGEWSGGGKIAYTLDGGKTVVQTDYQISGNPTGYGAVGKDNICFMGEYRTEDTCKTWTKMDGCTAVYAHDPETGRLFGADTCWIVYSDDDGKTWNRLGICENEITDMDYDPETGYVYAVYGSKPVRIKADGSEKRYTAINTNAPAADGICLDPENNNIIYVCGGDMVYRSLDGGETWTNLCRQPGDGRDNCPDGGKGASTIEFCKTTREIFTTGACRGVWKIKACDASEGK